MLKIKDNVELKELKKYGFKILVTDEELKENIKKDFTEFYCTRAFKDLGNHFALIVENDEYENQITILPNNEFHLKMSVTWQLDMLYDLIKADLVEKIEE